MTFRYIFTDCLGTGTCRYKVEVSRRIFYNSGEESGNLNLQLAQRSQSRWIYFIIAEVGARLLNLRRAGHPDVQVPIEKC